MRTLLQSDRNFRPVLARLYWSVLQYRREEHRSLPRRWQPAMVRPDGWEPYQPVRPAGTVRGALVAKVCGS
jgi:hypothetical protein